MDDKFTVFHFLSLFWGMFVGIVAGGFAMMLSNSNFIVFLLVWLVPAVLLFVVGENTETAKEAQREADNRELREQRERAVLKHVLEYEEFLASEKRISALGKRLP